MSGRINPFRLFNGAFIPNWLLEREEVSPGAKLLYGRLCQFAGRDGHCYPRQETIAESLGIAARQVRNLTTELREIKLIETEQPGLQRPLYYFFLRHEWMSAAGPAQVLSEGDELAAPMRKYFASHGGKDIAPRDRQSLSAPLLSEENQEKRIRGKGKKVEESTEECGEFVKAWNALPKPFPAIRVLSSGRARALRSRLAEPEWRASWKEALAKLAESPFLRGENERKWIADADFFLRPDTVARVLEGKYSNRTPDPETAKPAPFWRAHL